MIEIIAAISFAVVTLLSNGIWWRAYHSKAQLLRQEHDNHEDTQRVLVAALTKEQGIAGNALLQATAAKEEAVSYQKAMTDMEARFAELATNLPTPSLARHQHRWDTMTDAAGWRCGICGQPKDVA